MQTHDDSTLIPQPAPHQRRGSTGDLRGDLRSDARVDLRSGRHGDLHRDLRGGLACATLTLVTSVSYAAVAGAPLGLSMSAAAVFSGLIGAALGGPVASLLGPVPTQVFSPRASVAVVIASAAVTVSQHAQASPAAPAYVLAWLTACLLLAALLQCAFGALRLGTLIRLIPHSVTAGFTIGIAAQIVVSQWPHLFGTGSLHGLDQAAPLAVGLATVGAVAWTHWRGWSGWAMPAGLVAGMIAYAGLGTFFSVAALPSLQAIDLQAAPLFSVPGLAAALNAGTTLGQIPSLIAFAFVIAFVNSIETLSSAVVLEDLTHRRFDANRALIAGAVGSLASVCAGGLPVAGSAATSLVNIQAGGHSRRSTLIAGALLLAAAFIVSGLLDGVPMAVVAGLMITVAFALAQAPLIELAATWRRGAGKAGRISGDMAVAALVCGLILCTGIVTAVIGGVFAAMVLLIIQMRRTLVRRQYDATHPDAAAQLDFAIEPRVGRSIQILEIGQPLFFATVEAVVQVIERLHRSTRFAILDLSHIGAIDATAARMLSRCAEALRSRNRQILVVLGAHTTTFDRTVTSCGIFVNLGDALCFSAAHCGNAMAAADIRPQLGAQNRSHPIMANSTRRAPLRVVGSRDSPMYEDSPEQTTIIQPLRPVAAPPDSALAPQVVDQAARELAVYVGPVAKVLAQRAQLRATDIASLYQALALELHSFADREAFLRKQPSEQKAAGPMRMRSPPASAADEPTTVSSGVSLPAQVLEQATRELTPYLGPISKLLVKRAQAKALDREHLYHLLARQLGSAADRSAFLAAAGVSGPLSDGPR
jgi:sulfate permease, SulP family